jgi:HAD superfamily hydrolase (TIGR01457 family)
MDGTFYLGDKLIPGTLEFMNLIKETGKDYLFVTNNSSCDADFYAEKLARMGWKATPSDVLTSGEATAIYLKKQKPNAKVYLMGTPQLEAEFTAHGFILTADKPDYVIIGFDKTLTYEKLVTGCNLLRAGVPFIATHPDINCPTEDGFIPDCGAMLELIKSSTGVVPQKIIGKPNKEIVEAVLLKKNYQLSEVAMVGDRLYTDIATGKKAGITSILVMSGETTAETLEKSDIQPDYVFENLGAIAKELIAN